MAVIVTGMDMPGKCADCKLTYLDTGDDAYFGANEYRCVIDDSVIDCNVSEKAYDCPLKSVEGLIEQIRKHEFVHFKDNGGYYMEPAEIKDVVETIIKEYCGMEENNGNQD